MSIAQTRVPGRTIRCEPIRVIRRIARQGLVLGLLSLNLATAPAAAQDGPPHDMRKVLREACAGDFRALCPRVRPGEGRILGCFKENQAALSQSCRDALAPVLAGPTPGAGVPAEPK